MLYHIKKIGMLGLSKEDLKGAFDKDRCEEAFAAQVY